MTPRTCITPIAAIARGATAGLVGTLAMDALWYRHYRRDGGEDGFLSWELSASTDIYEQAGAPAQVGAAVFPARYDANVRASEHRQAFVQLSWTSLGRSVSRESSSASVRGRWRPPRRQSTRAPA